jgi:hypothetical protein
MKIPLLLWAFTKRPSVWWGYVHPRAAMLETLLSPLGWSWRETLTRYPIDELRDRAGLNSSEQS